MKINNYKKELYNNKKYKFNFNFLLFILIIILAIFDINNNNKILIKIKKILINYIYYIIYNPLIHIKDIINNIKIIFLSNKKLTDINDDLNKKIILNEIEKLEYKNYKSENEELKKLLDINISKKCDYIFSKIIYCNYLFFKLIIDKGENKNVHIYKSVLNCNNNIIGYVSLVDKNISHVNLIFNPKCKISAKNIRSNVNFIIKGSGINNLLVCKNFNLLINDPNCMKEGDLIISSGLDNIYPKGHTIGYISKIIKNNNNYYLDIKIKTFFDINDTNYLIILK